MQWFTNPYVIPMLLSGLIALICLMFVTPRRQVPGASALFRLIIAICIWAFAYAFELASADLHWQIFWSKVEYLGIPFVPLSFFIFAYEFSQWARRPSRNEILALTAPAVIFLTLAWTNESHSLIWSQIGQKDMGGYKMLALEHGPAFWALIGYSYILLVVGSIAVIRRVIQSPQEFKNQSYIILAGASATWLGNILYITGSSPVPELDLTPIGFMLSGVIFSVGLFRYGMLDIMPIAGESVLESLDDVVIVINSKGYLVYINRAFEYFFRVAPVTLVGKYASEAFAPWDILRGLTSQSNTVRREMTVAPTGRNPFIFDVRVFSIRWREQQLLGRVIVLRDITERRTAESRVSKQQIQESGLVNIPLMVMYRLSDEKIVDINRSFAIELGYERNQALGRSLLEIQVWDPFQRTEFLRALFKTGNITDHPLQLGLASGEKRTFHISASQVEIDSVKYVVMLGQEPQSDKKNAN